MFHALARSPFRMAPTEAWCRYGWHLLKDFPLLTEMNFVGEGKYGGKKLDRDQLLQDDRFGFIPPSDWERTGALV